MINKLFTYCIIKLASFFLLFLFGISILFSQSEWTNKYNNARKYYQEGKFNEAIIESKIALEVGGRELGNDHPNIAATLNIIAMSYYKIGEWKIATENYLKAVDIYTKYFGKNHIYIGNLFDKIAEIYIKQKLFHSADSLLSLAYKIILDTLGKYNEDVASVRFHQAISALYQSNLKNAELFILETLEIIKKVFTENHNYFAEALSSYGLILYYQGKLSDAENALLQSIKIKEQLYNKKIHPSMASTYSNLSQLYLSKGEIIEAERNAGLSMKVYEAIYGLKSIETLNSIVSLALILKYRGLNKQAEELLLKATNQSEALFKPTDSKLLFFYYNLGLFYLQNDKLDNIKNFINKVELIINNNSNYGYDLIYGYNLLAEYNLYIKNLDKSEDYFLKSLKLIDGTSTFDEIDIIINLALIKILKKDYQASEKYNLQVFNLYKQKEIGFTQQALNQFIRIADKYIFVGNIEKGKEYLNKANAMINAASFTEYPEQSKIYFHLAQIALLNKNYKEADDLINKSLATKEKYFGSYHPDIINILELKVAILEKLNLNDEIVKIRGKIEKIKIEMNK